MEEHMDTKTPHAEQSERQILAAALQKGNLRHAEGLIPEDFLAVRDQRIFRTMRDFENRGEPLILDRLTTHLTKDKPEEEPEGMAGHLSTLYAEEVLDCNLPGCVAEIRNRAIERELRKKYMESLQPGGIGDLSGHLVGMREFLDRAAASPFVEVKPVLHELDEINRRILDPGTKPVPTFSAMLNKNLNGGLQRQKVLTICSPAGAGKTTLALQLVEETVRAQSEQADGPPCVGIFVSMEMSKQELLTRSYSRIGLLNSGSIEGKEIAEDEEGAAKLKAAMQLYRDQYAPVLYFVEAPPGMTYRTVGDITRKIKAQIARAAGVDPFVILCVDPFNGLKTEDAAINSDETARVGEVVGGLKKLARDLDISVIVLSDTTKEATKEIEAGGKGRQTAPRGSYEITHRTDLLAEIIIREQLTKSSHAGEAHKTEERKRAEKYYADLEADYPRKSFGYSTVPVYAFLSFSKNRSGGMSDCPFVWQKACSRFVPIGKEQLGLDGGTAKDWRAHWHLASLED